jgi:hypothetical protein
LTLILAILVPVLLSHVTDYALIRWGVYLGFTGGTVLVFYAVNLPAVHRYLTTDSSTDMIRQLLKQPPRTK